MPIKTDINKDKNTCKQLKLYSYCLLKYRGRRPGPLILESTGFKACFRAAGRFNESLKKHLLELSENGTEVEGAKVYLFFFFFLNIHYLYWLVWLYYSHNL